MLAISYITVRLKVLVYFHPCFFWKGECIMVVLR